MSDGSKETQSRHVPAGITVLLVAAILLGLAAIGLSLFNLSHRAPEQGAASDAPVIASVSTPAPESGDREPSASPVIPKYVFLFVGDGMGINQVAATRYMQQARDGRTNDNGSPWRASFDAFPAIGLMSTHSKAPVTDSAASITAMLTGLKAENGTINYDADLNAVREPLAARLKRHGYAVGVLTSIGVDHATPAGMYASSSDRYSYSDIIEQGLARDYLDFLGGGGICAGDASEWCALAERNGFVVANDAEQVRTLTSGPEPVLALGGGGIKSYSLAYEIDRLRAAEYGGTQLALSELLDAAIRHLQDRDRFFILCEGAMIDVACSDLDVLTAMYEVQALDDAVMRAIDFYNEHPDDTLIVVLADHETGGLRIRSSADYTRLLGQIASYARFSSIMEELYAEEASFDEAMEKAAHYFSIDRDSLSADALSSLEKSYDDALADDARQDPFAAALCKMLSENARVGFDTSSHTGMPVAVYATGVGAAQFAGAYDNTAIFEKLCAVMALAD